MSLLLLFGAVVVPSNSTNVESLPLLYAVSGAGKGDLFLSFSVLNADGTPLSLVGISFSGSIHSATFTLATLTSGQIVVSNTNTITIMVPASQVVNWMPGQYELSVTATDGTNTRDLFSGALVTIGEMVPPVVKVLWSTGATVGNII